MQSYLIVTIYSIFDNNPIYFLSVSLCKTFPAFSLFWLLSCIVFRDKRRELWKK